MHLSRPTGDGTYGTSTVGVMGATPAALVGMVAGAQFGPSWMDTDGPRIAYQNGTAGWIVESYNTNTAARVTLSALGQNFMAAGGGQWASYLAGGASPGVHSSVTIASPTAPLAGAFLLDVGTAGEIVVCDYQATAVGITVYNSSGTAIYQNPSVTVGGVARLVDGYLGFQALAPYTYQGQQFSAGWHLINVNTGIIPYWFPRTDSVNWLVPFLGADGTTLYVLERTEFVSVRVAARNQGYSITASTGIGFNPDGMEISSGVCRAGYCTDLGESLSSLVLYDVNMTTGVTNVGTVSGGGMVFAAGPTLEVSTYPVGPAEGSPLARSRIPPMIHPVVDPRVGFTATQPWKEYWQGINDNAVAAANAASGGSGGGGGGGSSAAGFGVIAGDVAPLVAATQLNDTLALDSSDNSILFTGNPISKTVDLRVNRSVAVSGPPGVRGESGRMGVPGPAGPVGATGSAGPMGPPPRRSEDVTRVVMVGSQSSASCDCVSYVPLAMGIEPLTFVSDGNGNPILVAFTP